MTEDDDGEGLPSVDHVSSCTEGAVVKMCSEISEIIFCVPIIYNFHSADYWHIAAHNPISQNPVPHGHYTSTRHLFCHISTPEV